MGHVRSVIMDKPERAYVPWQPEEQEELALKIAEFVVAQARYHKRTHAAIQNRVRNLLDTRQITDMIVRLGLLEGV